MEVGLSWYVLDIKPDVVLARKTWNDKSGFGSAIGDADKATCCCWSSFSKSVEIEGVDFVSDGTLLTYEIIPLKRRCEVKTEELVVVVGIVRLNGSLEGEKEECLGRALKVSSSELLENCLITS